MPEKTEKWGIADSGGSPGLSTQMKFEYTRPIFVGSRPSSRAKRCTFSQSPFTIAGAALPVGHAHERELLRVPTAADPKDRSPPREEIERRPLLGEGDRVAKRQHQDHRAEPEGSGDARQGPEERDRLEPRARVRGRRQQE